MTFIDAIGLAYLPLWLTMAVSLFFAGVEFVAASKMAAWPFRLGPVVACLSFPASSFDGLKEPRGRVGALGYRRLPDRSLLVRYMDWRPALVPLLGTLSPTDSGFGLRIRAPLGAVVFWLSWWTNAVYLGVIALLQRHEWLLVIAAVLAGVILCSAPFALWIRLERRRLLKLVELDAARPIA